jgi:hypothetical protein
MLKIYGIPTDLSKKVEVENHLEIEIDLEAGGHWNIDTTTKPEGC